MATGTTVAGVAVAALAGYALARFDLPLRRYLLLMVMGVQMFPLVVLLIPLFVVMKALGLLDSWLGLVVAYLSFTTPLAVWLLRSFFQTIPKDLEEAANKVPDNVAALAEQRKMFDGMLKKAVG